MVEPIVRGFVRGDRMNEETTLGPIAEPNHVPELEAFVQDARAKGARVVAGGKPASVDGRGRFFEATLLADCDQSMKLFRQESFGPIVPVMSVASDDEAIARMNDSHLCLKPSVWTITRHRPSQSPPPLS